MVDLSASTRGASFRDRATLERRVRQLLGDVPFRVTYFAQQNTVAPPDGSPLGDLPGDATRFAPPAAPAVLLFSDGRFELPPTAPPTFVVADANLDQPGDAAVTRLEQRGRELATTVHNGGDRARTLALGSSATRPAIPVEPGAVTITRPFEASAATAIGARLNPADRWPENDGLSLPLPVPPRSQRWLVMTSRPAPGAGWLTLSPDALPDDPAAYLAPAAIVLDNLAASDLSDAQHRLLEQYVRDLGGALVIAGGDRTFAPGFYAGTPLEALSPLASVPPVPAVHWVLLADASGSMSQAATAAARGSGATRWQLAAAAVARLLPQLPPDDPVSAGSFAAELTWWSTGRTARETAGRPLPPADIVPNGPTNLAAALRRVAREVDGKLPTELLVVSDADVTIDQPDALARDLRDQRPACTCSRSATVAASRRCAGSRPPPGARCAASSTPPAGPPRSGNCSPPRRHLDGFARPRDSPSPATSPAFPPATSRRGIACGSSPAPPSLPAAPATANRCPSPPAGRSAPRARCSPWGSRPAPANSGPRPASSPARRVIHASPSRGTRRRDCESAWTSPTPPARRAGTSTDSPFA
jgi:hypothetical protein